jgi:hydrophobic/amphiphilic exporter-1 (mainly G- bacteria), HAE1 family
LVIVVYKQPGANVIDTVDKIKAELPRLQATMPAAIKIFTLSDRTQTIRAAVEDVQFTLLLTIALVVMVIFIFLRNLWATTIPSVTVPLALLGACALMWFANYSLDNLSLMALTDRPSKRASPRNRTSSSCRLRREGLPSGPQQRSYSWASWGLS